jgi:hypothetical protein
MLTLAIDALSEGDSRAFMGGLPKWEYVIHLFANGFHFAAIALALAARPLMLWSAQPAADMTGIMSSAGAQFAAIVAANTLPGAILLALLHAALLNQRVADGWRLLKTRMQCC